MGPAGLMEALEEVKAVGLKYLLPGKQTAGHAEEGVAEQGSGDQAGAVLCMPSTTRAGDAVPPRVRQQEALPSEPEGAAALRRTRPLDGKRLSAPPGGARAKAQEPALHPRPPLYAHKGINRGQKNCQIKPTAAQEPPACPGCRSGPSARQRVRWLARNRWAALGASERH